MLPVHSVQKPPFTLAVRQALRGVNDSTIEADLLFLEAWGIHPSSHLGVTLRASQIRRANPRLTAAIDAELRAGSSVFTHSADRKKLELAIVAGCINLRRESESFGTRCHPVGYPPGRDVTDQPPSA